MNDLVIIEHNNQRVLTTKQLAEAYETDINNIKVNFSRNGDRFEEGKHYFVLRGNALKEFKDRVTDSNIVGRNANQLYLWTERGALRHAKILDTDKAWEVYEKLEETYFRAKQMTQTFKELSPQLQVLINLELKQKKLEEEIASAKAELDTVKHRIDNIDNVNLIGDLRQRLNAMVRKYAREKGINYGKAWSEFKKAFNTAYHTNLELCMTYTKKKHGLKDITIPQYLSIESLLEDAIRVADKMLNS
ncbi:ORF6N domain-containing protein [Caloranaerobacter sp. DY30410]|uniref:ORF6N domain-containing protein n=1 Tax=Caloranaerobacter sp. DY30410 TaxID=3238305 RepID=UPI003D0386FD